MAVNTLQVSLPAIEYGDIAFNNNVSCLHPTYIRGEAYLASGQGTAAAAEFQKILDHGGIVWNCWTGALARLGLARANAWQAKTVPRRLQEFSYSLERRRPRHSHPEASQSRVCEVAIMPTAL